MHVPKLVCVTDGQEMVIDRTGIVVELSHSNGHRIKVSSDVFGCPDCGARIARLAGVPIVEGWQPNYDAQPASVSAEFAH